MTDSEQAAALASFLVGAGLGLLFGAAVGRAVAWSPRAAVRPLPKASACTGADAAVADGGEGGDR